MSDATPDVCVGVATALIAAPVSHPAARFAAYAQGTIKINLYMCYIHVLLILC